MKLVNANLKTAKEAILRMVDGGEVFYSSKGVDIWFCGTRDRFYCSSGGMIAPCSWVDSDDVTTWQIEDPEAWTDDISHDSPALCWVSDTHSSPIPFESSVKVVVSFRKNKVLPFLTEIGVSWKYAIPVKPEDLFSGDSHE